MMFSYFIYSFTVFNAVCPLTYHFLQLFIVGNTYLFISFDRGTVTKMYMLHAKYFSKNRYNATPLQAVRYIQFSAFLFEKNYSMTTLPVKLKFFCVGVGRRNSFDQRGCVLLNMIWVFFLFLFGPEA